MTGEIFDRTNDLPDSAGVFNLINAGNQSLYIGAAENIKKEVKAVCGRSENLDSQAVRVEVFASGGDLITLYGTAMRRRKPLYNFSLAEENFYPHFKITREKYPRLRVTRRVTDDDAEYFGAFLPETGVRFMLGFINRTFKTRGCDIAIDGEFPLPCPEFYRKKCLAPCVETLCDRANYLETINLARLFLRNNKEEFDRIVSNKIEASSAALDFELAARWLDFLQTANGFWTDKERRYRLDDAIDTFEIKQTNAQILIHLATTRNRKNLGRRTFAFENRAGFSAHEILAQILWQFYPFHTPNKIVVPVDFPQRKFLEKTLASRAAKDFKITVVKQTARKITARRALRRTEFEFGQDNLKPVKMLAEIQTAFQKEFDLTEKPTRIEAFDVAHISGTDFVGAKAVWTAGKIIFEDYEFWFSDKATELETLAEALEKRFASAENLPDLILIDGGKSQLQSALNALGGNPIPIISAVKPPKKHGEISHFLFAGGDQKAFDKTSDAALILLKLRDEAHDLANYVHRTKREFAHYNEFFQLLPGLGERERQSLLRKFGSLSALKNAAEIELIEHLGAEKGAVVFKRLRENFENAEPFIVPVRFDDANGDAADLRPLELPGKLYRKMRGKTVSNNFQDEK